MGVTSALYQCPADLCPRRLTLRSSAPRRFPEYTAIGDLLVVSARVAHIIERFEPERFGLSSSHATLTRDYSRKRSAGGNRRRL